MNRPRKSNSSLNVLMERIEQECAVLEKQERRKLLADKLDEHALLVRDFLRLHDDLEKLETLLERHGLTHCGDSFQLTQKASVRIEEKWRQKRRGFRVKRDNLYIQWALANADKRELMLRYFFAEVAESFPTLAAALAIDKK